MKMARRISGGKRVSSAPFSLLVGRKKGGQKTKLQCYTCQTIFFSEVKFISFKLTWQASTAWTSSSDSRTKYQNMPQRMSKIKMYSKHLDNKTEAQLPWLSDIFSPTYQLPLTCRNMPLFSQTMLCRDETDYPSGSPLKITSRSLRLLLMDICTKGCLDCGDSVSLASPSDAFTVEHLVEVRAQQACVWGCFLLVFLPGSIAMLHWLPVTQGSDQYWVSGAAEQAAKGLDREYAPWAV